MKQFIAFKDKAYFIYGLGILLFTFEFQLKKDSIKKTLSEE